MAKVTLKQGILRGENRITEIDVKKPLTKQLRGTNLISLMQLNVDEWCVVLPRITTPKLDKADFATMPAGDLLQLSMKAMEQLSEDIESADDESETDEGKGEAALA